jgi:mannose-6-phosphate isomerase-like protein (cupin superfamily)
MANYLIAQLDEVPPVPCPCGQARRAFALPENKVATVHLVNICADSRTHYHKKMAELYVVLEGEGHIELDGERFALRPLTAVLIKPGCRHRAVGNLRLLNIPIPPFDEADEWFDASGG